MITETETMRTIKFRGKRVDNGECIIGNLFVPNGFVKGVYICPKISYVDFLPDYEEVTDMEEAMKDGCALGHFIEVTPETVGQFTGLWDDSEICKEVYEGSKVKVLYTDWTSKSDTDERTIGEYLDSISKESTVIWYVDRWVLLFEGGNHGSIMTGNHGFIRLIDK